MSNDSQNPQGTPRETFEKEMHEMAGVSEINREDGAAPEDAATEFPKHHPPGLWVLFTTEMWERFCYYGMRALLTLYLVAAVSGVDHPGFGWSQETAYRFYGIFTGLVYLMPLLCGWVADRFIGQHRSMLFGGLMIAVGEFLLAGTELVRNGKPLVVTFQNDPLACLAFFSGMFLIIVGTGFFKPCISVMVGQLYGKGDPRRDGGFTIFYMGINLGAFLCPFVAGTLAENYGWGWGFFSAGCGMVFGLITYTCFRPKYLSHVGLPPKRNTSEMTPEQIEAEKKREYEMTRPLNSVDLDKVFVIVALTLFTIAFWLAFEQAGSSLNIFAKNETDRRADPPVPVFMKDGILLQNEFANDIKAEIDRINRTKLQVARLLQGGDIPEPETSRKKGADTRDPDEIVKELMTTAKRLVADEAPAEAPDGVLNEQTLGYLAKAKTAMSDEELAAFLTDIARGHQLDDAKKKELQNLFTGYQKSYSRLKKSITRADYVYVPGAMVRTFPATWYQSTNAMFIVMLAPLFAWFWIFLEKRRIQPSTPVKFGIGLLLVSCSFLVMIPGAVQSAKTGGFAGPQWLVLSYLLATCGELCLSPVGLSMVTKLAPVRYASFFMGFWFVSSAIANYLSGTVAALFGTSDEGSTAFSLWFGPQGGMADFFLLISIIPAVVGVIVLLSSQKLKKMMHGAA